MGEKGESNEYRVNCASCGKEALVVKEIFTSLPKFGSAVLISMICKNCGYRTSDVVLLENKGPKRTEFKVKDGRDLNARVVRSSSARIEIPELGLELKPGSMAEGFITNIEGVLTRFLEVAEQLRDSAEGSERERAADAIQQIIGAMNGKVSFTIVIEDEMGNSGVEPST
ncbi:MAG: ZPR1 zinc finger domain-containing protein [Candidatus Methanomethylicia archaeon]|nr:ZPR1 zinc finger domain-containing protein [Candidatus Methanomethylicia archaeon]